MSDNTEYCSNTGYCSICFDTFINDARQSSPATSLVDRIFRKFDQDSLDSNHDWRTQVDLFLQDSSLDEYEHRNKILRLLIEDPLPSQQMEETEQHELKEPDLSLYAMREHVIEEARQMYYRYARKHPEAIRRAAFTFFHWRQKHSGYDYDDILERSLAKRSLITLFYRLNVTDPMLDELFEHFVDVSSSTSMEAYESVTHVDLLCDSGSSGAQELILGGETLERRISFEDAKASSISHSLGSPYCHLSPVDSHCCSFEDFPGEGSQHGRSLDDGPLDCSNRAGSFTEGVNTAKHQGYSSPSIFPNGAFQRIQADKYEYRIIHQNGMPVVEIID